MPNPEVPGETTPEDAATPRPASIEPSSSADSHLETAPDVAAPSPSLASPDNPFGSDPPAPKIEPSPVEYSFDVLGLPAPLRQAVRDMGWERPTAVQAATFAPIADGKDVLVQSQTGTGKTGAFCLPWL